MKTKAEIEAYKAGFLNGVDIKENYKYNLFGLPLETVLDIIGKHIIEEDKPVFELRYPSGVFTYKIWADGRIEGFNDKMIVINRIPQLLKQNNQ